jgi:hypothetical protein
MNVIILVDHPVDAIRVRDAGSRQFLVWMKEDRWYYQKMCGKKLASIPGINLL